ncbi:MAG TPA: condensation domain-containing protein, partial [Candidatus Angelobacter sp.]
MSHEYCNLNEVLRWRAEHDSTQPAFTFLKESCEEEAQWSYAKLDHAARAIAGRLQKSVSIGQRILLLFPPSLEFVAAFWGCLYAGAIAVPAYPVRSPANLQRLKNIVQDCQPSAVLTTRRGLLRMKHAIDGDLAALEWIETDSLAQELADAWQEPQISRDSIALLQYTSGSTGQPKGVVVNHGNLLHNEEIIQSTFGQSNRSVIVGWLPLYHDMGLMGTILQPVYSGARCILMSPNAFLQQPFRWLKAISRYRATTSGGPNFAYELCVRKITDEECATLDLSSWTVAFNGAETVRAETLEKFAARFAEVGFSRKSFCPCYGLAEATLLVSAQSRKQQAAHLTIDANKLGHNRVKVVAAGAGAMDVVSCGRTADGHEIAIVDPETLRRRARNQVGEIWVAGPSVAKGYWNRPEETTRLFAARTTDTGEGPFLRTGDLGFIRNGSLFITGRSKDLIIIRGRNHYPQDIELTVQGAHPALKLGLGASFSVQGEEGEHLVVLHEVEHGKEQQLSGAIDSICQAIAEQHEIQAQAVVLLRSGTIPRTSSGKIQRYLCRDLFLQGKLSPILEWRAGERGPIASSTQAVLKSTEGLQEWLAEKLAVWAGVARENILVHEPISRYGLDSLASIELSHAAERELALSLPLTSLMQGKSIIELTRELINGQPAFAEIQAGNVIEEATLSEGQKSLWYMHRLAPESTAYNLAFVARIVNGADTGVLRHIFQTLADRHPSLRTTLHANNAGELFQRIHPLQNAAVVEIDASGWNDSVLEQHFQQAGDVHFNLELGPLFRVTLFRRSDSECFIAITLHHIIGDLWSLAMLLHEMGRLYAAETKGEKLTLPPPESSYSHFVLWQRKMLFGAEGARLQDYWTRQLEGELPVLELSTDRIRPTVQTYHGAAKPFDLGAELTRNLRNVCHDNTTTLNVILLAAFQVLLHRHSGQCDLLVGSPAVNRTRASWANVFGYFVNPVVLRSQLHRNLPFDEFLAETHTTVVEALEHQDYPFSTLVEKLQPDRDASRSPLFQVMFVFEKTRFLEEEGISAFALGGKGTRLEFDGLTFESVLLENTKALFDLTLRVAEAGEETRCSFEYNTDLFDEETISRMAEQWQQLLHGIVAAETTLVRDLPLLNDAERKQIVEGWNRTEQEYGQGWVHQLFEEQVARAPEAIAVEYEEERLNYGELNRRSNQLAHYLRSMGV